MYYRALRVLNIASLAMFLGTSGLLVATYPAARVAAGAGVCFWYVATRPPRRFTNYGSATWAQMRHLRRELAEGNGLCVGVLLGARIPRLDGLRSLFSPRFAARHAVLRFLMSCQRKQAPMRVRLNDAIHTCVVAPTGAGKGTSLVVPYLLTCPDSMVVIDIKGENAHLTAGHRAKVFGHRVILLDPFGVASSQSDTLNFLDGIDPDDPGSFDTIKAIMGVFADDASKTSGDPYWGRGGQDATLMAACFAVAHMPEGMRNLQTVRDLLASQQRFLKAAEAAGNSPAMDGMLARLGSQFAGGMNPKELGSFLSASNRNMAVLDTPAIARNTTRSSFDPREMFTHPRGVTAYLVLPPDKLKSHGKVLALWVGAFLRACVQNGLQERKLVRFLLDEAAALGQMDEVSDAIQAYRGYGVRLTFILQNLAQVSRIMPPGQEDTLLGNCTTVFFGITDRKTAQEVSETAGKWTQVVSGGNDGWSVSRPAEGGKGGNSSSSGGTSWSLAARELVTASELMTADPSVAITVAPGKPPILTRLIRYYEPEFRNTGRVGPVKAAFDTACLFLAALFVAAVNLAVFLNGGK